MIGTIDFPTCCPGARVSNAGYGKNSIRADIFDCIGKLIAVICVYFAYAPVLLLAWQYPFFEVYRNT